MYIHIKHMVCPRCITAVNRVFEEQGIHPTQVSLGKVEIEETLTSDQIQQIQKQLASLGFEWLDDPKSQCVESIKNEIIQVIHHTMEWPDSFPQWLSDKLGKEYAQLSKLFSEVEALSLEQFIILQKVEKIKELLTYQEYTLNELAWKLGYSSPAYLSAQFKRVTGLTPSAFKSLQFPTRKGADW